MNDGLPHIVPGQPRRSMYGEHNTHDETISLTAAAFQELVDEIQWVRSDTYHLDDREPIRVVATVGRRIEP